MIEVPKPQQLDSKSEEILNKINDDLGMTPNIYAAIGYSPNTLEHYLDFSNSVGSKSFDKKWIEAIKLAVSEVNDCDYCKAAHTAAAKKLGFSEEETLDIRSGEINDLRLNAVITLAQEMARNRGTVTETTLNNFLTQGYEHKDLIELIGVVTAVTLTNYVHGTMKFPIDFPKVKELSEVEMA